MKTEQPVLVTSITAAEALPANQFVNMAGYIADDEYALGICNTETDLGEQAPITTIGIALVLSGNSIGVGDFIKPTAGKAVTIVGDPYADSSVRAVALDSATGADELIRVLLI